MTVFIFKPSNEVVGKYKIRSVEDIQSGLEDFLKELSFLDFDFRYCYLETAKRTWTIVGTNPVMLEEGRISASQRKDAAPPTTAA